MQTLSFKGDGVTDYTSEINEAVSTTTKSGETLIIPSGSYITKEIVALAGMKIVGESKLHSVIKQKDFSNTNLLTSYTNTVDDIWVENLRFDGNCANNSSGTTLCITGQRPTLKNIDVVNSPGDAIYTDWAGPSFRLTGFEGQFTNITIDSPQKSGWIHRGPSDSHFDNIMIIDASQQANNAFYGMYLDPTGTGSNGRFNNFHHWNRSSTKNVAASGMFVGFGGNTFTNSHFEGATTPLSIISDGNTFESCEYYAPRGVCTIDLVGSCNKLSGIMGITSFTGNSNYAGILLSGGSNMIDMVLTGSIRGMHFASSNLGGNIIRMTGYVGDGGGTFTGTPKSNDIVTILLRGSGGGTFVKN
jgi:hypothetical protein